MELLTDFTDTSGTGTQQRLLRWNQYGKKNNKVVAVSEIDIGKSAKKLDKYDARHGKSDEGSNFGPQLPERTDLIIRSVQLEFRSVWAVWHNGSQSVRANGSGHHKRCLSWVWAV
ncbi:hypothetical protein PIB30_005814 [Stylosanthes scabra]|uniref:Uncharacterized protein n=1 Tax=Stylosanthes scabra TaxID=79078 RepID=A0ABU6Y490_9FABA|nr:hypothetical protein [Stylosanthes scabra]